MERGAIAALVWAQPMMARHVRLGSRGLGVVWAPAAAKVSAVRRAVAIVAMEKSRATMVVVGAGRAEPAAWEAERVRAMEKAVEVAVDAIAGATPMCLLAIHLVPIMVIQKAVAAKAAARVARAAAHVWRDAAVATEATELTMAAKVAFRVAADVAAQAAVDAASGRVRVMETLLVMAGAAMVAATAVMEAERVATVVAVADAEPATMKPAMVVAAMATVRV